MNWTALSFTSFLTLLYVTNKVKETHKKIFTVKNITYGSIHLHLILNSVSVVTEVDELLFKATCV